MASGKIKERKALPLSCNSQSRGHDGQFLHTNTANNGGKGHFLNVKPGVAHSFICPSPSS